MFDNVKVEDIKNIRKDRKCKPVFIKSFQDMVSEYEMKYKAKLLRGRLTQPQMNKLVVDLAPDFMRFMDNNRKRVDGEKSIGVDEVTWSQSRNGEKPAPPWLFAMMCYLSGYDLKEQLYNIKCNAYGICQDVLIDRLVTDVNNGLIKSYTVKGLKGISFETDYSKMQAVNDFFMS